MLTPRPVRMSGTHIAAKLDDRVVDVSNLSLTGVLLVVDEAVPMDTRAVVTLAVDSTQVKVEAQVIRVAPAGPTLRWFVALKFIGLSPEARKAIPQLLSKSWRP